MGFVTFRDQLREGELVPAVWVDRAQRGLAGGQMVWMGCVDSIEVAYWRLANDSIWFDLADHPADRFSQLEVGFDRPVWESEKVEFGDPDNLGRSGLLMSPDLRHPLAADCVVESARFSAGDEAIDNVVSCLGEGCSRAGTAEIDIVWVRHHMKERERLGAFGHSVKLAIQLAINVFDGEAGHDSTLIDHCLSELFPVGVGLACNGFEHFAQFVGGGVGGVGRWRSDLDGPVCDDVLVPLIARGHMQQRTGVAKQVLRFGSTSGEGDTNNAISIGVRNVG